ncbi:hypothetical protein V8C86DRAFT_3018516 [Haematococcus lacustris]
MHRRLDGRRAEIRTAHPNFADSVVQCCLRPVHRGHARTSAPRTLVAPKATCDSMQASSSTVEQPPQLSAPLSFEHRHGVRDQSGRVLLKSLNQEELEEWCTAVGEPPKRAKQLLKALYGKGRWVRRLEEMDNDPAMAFSAQFKAKVSAAASLSGGMTLQSVQTARDGTHKLVFSLAEGEGGARGSVETVLIPMTNRSGTNLRYTACLSTQVGCAMNCQFCYTGRMGLQGNLSTAQIVEQAAPLPRSVPISNIVFMGMGEPLDNFDCVMAAIDVLAQGLELARSKIIVSTVGLADRMDEFLSSKKAKLALSLHATTDEVRNWIVPTNRRFPLQRLVTTLEQHFPAHAPSARGDNFVVLEYVLLGGVNDSLADAERLVALTANIYCMVNLIVFNPWEGTTFKKSTDQAVRAFRGVLMAAGRVCTLRVSKGDDEMAACGQLGDPGQGRKRVPIAEPPAAFRQLVAGAVAVSGA